jgi:hypothetical protein
MMEAASTSETSVNFNQTTRQKRAIFILAAVRTSNLTILILSFHFCPGLPRYNIIVN